MTDLPSYAVGLWIAGDTLCIRIPPSRGAQSAHIVRFPASEHGLRAMYSFLKAREAHEAFDKIGHPASPTQADVNRLVAMSHVKTRVVDKRSRRDREMDSLLDELGDLI